MNFQESWEKALRNTEIIRSRIQTLATFADTKVPYILLSESEIDQMDTVVRKGEVVIQKPSLILPSHAPQIEGFEWETQNNFEKEQWLNFLFVRGISIPSLKYNNQTHALEMFEGKLSNAIEHFKSKLQQEENTTVGLLTSPQDCWQFSLLLFSCTQITKNIDADIKRMFEQFKNQ